MTRHSACFRIYAELNDFLPAERRQREFTYAFDGTPAVKDAVEAMGIPHTEVDIILVNGRSVDFSHNLRDGDRVAVYPVFESLDITPLVRLRPEPLRRTAFIADVHLGKLARLLRLAGFDTLYRNDLADAEIVRLSLAEQRIILTRDRGLLKVGAVTHGCFIRSGDPYQQLAQIMQRFDLYGQIRPFHRCLRCNGRVEPVDKAEITPLLPPRTAQAFDEFTRCRDCGRIYWKGSHWEKLRARLAALRSSDR
ncbi:MAG: Mut7-C ubiquitin/RNAse domain-containing protein [Acidobacteria bacterium]|nr:Mut7-C ubiquitin/RNAse domain-containing protein [Acidobacteriota bacterium]